MARSPAAGGCTAPGFSLMKRSGAAGRSGAPFGLEGRGRPLEFRLLHVVEFAEDGRIQREAVWPDLAAIIRQLPQG